MRFNAEKWARVKGKSCVTGFFPLAFKPNLCFNLYIHSFHGDEREVSESSLMRVNPIKLTSMKSILGRICFLPSRKLLICHLIEVIIFLHK